MNWITLTALAGIAAWFEYNYRRSRRRKSTAARDGDAAAIPSEAARVAEPGGVPSIPPGSENDKRINTAV